MLTDTDRPEGGLIVPDSPRGRRPGPWLALIGLAAISFVLHALPYAKTPFSTDVNWHFRVQVLPADSPAAQHIPPVFTRFAVQPGQSTFDAFLGWHAFTSRYNIFDFVALRTIARLAPDSAFAWKLYAWFFGTGATLFLFLLLQRCGVSLQLAWWLGIVSLFFLVDDYWVEYKAAEPRAAFFFMLAAWATARPNGRWRDPVAALAMGVAVLTKEPFAAGWVLLLSLWYAREVATGDGSIRPWVRRFVRWALPHAAVVVACGAFIVYLRATHPVAVSYAEIDRSPGVVTAVKALIVSFLPTPADLLPIVIGAALLVLVNLDKGAYRGLARLRSEPFARVVLAGALLHLIAHVLIYRAGGRVVHGHYVVPLNYTVLLALGIVLRTSFSNFRIPLNGRAAALAVAALLLANHSDRLAMIGSNLLALSLLVAVAVAWRLRRWLVAPIVAGFLLLGAADRMVFPRAYSFHNECVTFAQLLADIGRQAPPRATIIARVDDPYLNETVQSAEANLILRADGRRDLQFRFQPQDGSLGRANPFVRNLIRIYNDRVYEPDRPQLQIHLDRAGQQNVSKMLFPDAVKLLVRQPAAFIRTRYASGRHVRGLNYRLESTTAPRG